jgi:hypothetical protein
MTQKWGHGQDMRLKRTSATSVPPNALVHSKMRTIEDTPRTSATKNLLDETSIDWKHDRSTHKTTMDGGKKENEGHTRKR